MKVITTSPVEGVESDVEIDVDKGKGDWLIANGYARPASKPNGEDFGLLATSTKAKDDPTLAENREHPDAAAGPDGTSNPEAKQLNTLPS